MIAEIIPERYDPNGRKVLRPDLRRHGPHPTFPMGRYVSQPLTIKCSSFDDIRKFLRTCKYTSDKEQFGRDDYWQPPEQFEQTKLGDCDDFALWTWRQLLTLGLDARFVMGPQGRYGSGHAWAQYQHDGKTFLVEPLMHRAGGKIPRLTTLNYHPKLSVAWDGEKIAFYAHEDSDGKISMVRLIPLVFEWIGFWSWFWLRNFYRIPLVLWRRTIGELPTSEGPRRT